MAILPVSPTEMNQAVNKSIPTRAAQSPCQGSHSDSANCPATNKSVVSMTPSPAVARAIALLRQAKHVVALTGAGISTPSGIPDFRSPESGVWDRVDPMEVASIYAFRQNPTAFFDWLRPLAQTILKAQPNPAHMALASLEANGRLQAVITQNIDLLHSKAGSHTVYEVHGNMRRVTCQGCHAQTDALPVWQQFAQPAKSLPASVVDMFSSQTWYYLARCCPPLSCTWPKKQPENVTSCWLLVHLWMWHLLVICRRWPNKLALN